MHRELIKNAVFLVADYIGHPRREEDQKLQKLLFDQFATELAKAEPANVNRINLFKEIIGATAEHQRYSDLGEPLRSALKSFTINNWHSIAPALRHLKDKLAKLDWKSKDLEDFFTKVAARGMDTGDFNFLINALEWVRNDREKLLKILFAPPQLGALLSFITTWGSTNL